MNTGTYKNPILYADYSDPDAIRVGEDYYMVASSFTYLPGVPLLHSRDLVHWEIMNYCVPALPFEKYDRPSHGSGIITGSFLSLCLCRMRGFLWRAPKTRKEPFS